MSVEAVLAAKGGIALLGGIFGGGIKAKEIEIPQMHVALRVISVLIGSLLILVAATLSRAGAISGGP